MLIKQKLKIKGKNTPVFIEGEEPGVIATQTFEMTDNPSPMDISEMNDMERKLILENIEVISEKDEEDGTTIQSERQILIDLYGEEKGNRLADRNKKANEIIKEALKYVEFRWKEEFPEDDLTNEKPYAYYWFINRPAN